MVCIIFSAIANVILVSLTIRLTSSTLAIIINGNNGTTNGTTPNNNDSSDSEPYLFALPDVVLSSLTVFLGALICAGAGELN